MLTSHSSPITILSIVKAISPASAGTCKEIQDSTNKIILALGFLILVQYIVSAQQVYLFAHVTLTPREALGV